VGADLPFDPMGHSQVLNRAHATRPTPAAWDASSRSRRRVDERGSPSHRQHARGARGADENAGGEVQQVSDRIRILSDRPSDRKPNDPGQPRRRRGEAELACGGRWSAKDASGLPGALVRLRCVSGRTSSSRGISFSDDEASSGAESSPPDSDRPLTATDITPGTGATSTKTSHARQDRAALVKVRYECTSMPPRTSPRLRIESKATATFTDQHTGSAAMEPQN
jgi:hypothetical protein